jgi:SAM-dependent methyltransferase
VTEYALRLSDQEVLRYRFMAERARTDEATDWAAAGIVAGARVADVGCGPGALLAQLADAVGRAGAVAGVDADAGAVERAVGEVAGHPHASAVVGRADATGLDPGAFDVVMCRHVLAHNGGREAAIVEHLASLARPGGAVYLVDVHLGGLRTVPEQDDFDFVERYADFHAARGGDVSIGLRLGALLEDAGLAVERFRCASPVDRLPPGLRPPMWAARDAMLAEGAATPDDLVRWEATFERYDRTEPRPWIFVPMFLAVGRRPA